MIEIVWEYFVNFIEVILFYIFVNQKLHPNTNISNLKFKQYLFLLFRFLIVCIMNQISAVSTVTLTLSCLLEMLFACTFYNDKLLYKTFIGMLYTALCMLAEFLPFFCLTVFFGISSNNFFNFGTLRMPVTALYLTLIAVFVFLFRYLFNKEPSASMTQRIIYTAISLLGVSVGHYILFTMVISEHFGIEEISFRLAIINLFFMFLFIALLVFIYQLGISYSNTQKLLEIQKIRALEEQEYQNIMEKMTALRDMKHDMENHLNSLQIMANNLSSSEMQQYICSLRNTLECSHIFVSTGNMAVDCILSSKISLARDSNISTDFSVLLSDNFKMDAVSICSLLGNLWDNAIDACKSLLQHDGDKLPYILFFMKPYQDMTIIHIENNYYGEINLLPDGKFQTNKKNPEHGIGLERIETIVNKEQGILSIDVKNHIFSVHILVPQKGELE